MGSLFLFPSYQRAQRRFVSSSSEYPWWFVNCGRQICSSACWTLSRLIADRTFSLQVRWHSTRALLVFNAKSRQQGCAYIGVTPLQGRRLRDRSCNFPRLNQIWYQFALRHMARPHPNRKNAGNACWSHVTRG